jgi:hypothetical protein
MLINRSDSSVCHQHTCNTRENMYINEDLFDYMKVTIDASTQNAQSSIFSQDLHVIAEDKLHRVGLDYLPLIILIFV